VASVPQFLVRQVRHVRYLPTTVLIGNNRMCSLLSYPCSTICPFSLLMALTSNITTRSDQYRRTCRRKLLAAAYNTALSYESESRTAESQDIRMTPLELPISFLALLSHDNVNLVLKPTDTCKTLVVQTLKVLIGFAMLPLQA